MSLASSRLRTALKAHEAQPIPLKFRSISHTLSRSHILKPYIDAPTVLTYSALAVGIPQRRPGVQQEAAALC